MGMPVGSALEFKQLATPAANPASGANLLYPKADGLWYTKNSAGVETAIGGGGTPVGWPKASVKAATTANITLSAPQTIDGISCIAGDRVLVKNQTLPANNGVYVVAAGAWARASDADTAAEISNCEVPVDQGATQVGIWRTTFKTTDTLGTTALVFAESYSDINPPYTLNQMYQPTATVPQPPANQSTLSTPDGKALVLRAADNTVTIVNPAPVEHTVFHGGVTGTYTLNPLTAGTLEPSNVPMARLAVDLSRATQYRVVIGQRVVGGGATTCEGRMQYATDGSTQSTWAEAGTGTLGCNLMTGVANSLRRSGWIDLAAGAKTTDTFLRFVIVTTGTATTAPTLASVKAQFR